MATTKEKEQKNKEKESNKTVSKELLESYRKALYKVKSFFDSVETDFDDKEFDDKMAIVESILKTGEKLGKNIETLAVLESKVEKEEMENNKRRGGGSSALFED